MRAALMLPVLAGFVTSGAATSCPTDDGATLQSNSRTFHVQCSTDRSGGDLANGPVWVSSLDDCIAACSSNSQCRAAIWSPGTPGPCYLKGEITEGTYSPSNLVSVTNPLYECPNSDGTNQYVSLDSSYTIECYKDRIGGDMPNSPVYVPDLEHCLQACESNPGCIDVSWKPSSGRLNGPCYLKSSIQPVFSDNTVWAARRHSVCPDLDGTTYEDGCGATYQVECYKDRYGAVMAPSPVTTHSFEACIYLCGATAGCVDISWVQGYPTGTCYLKSELGQQEDDTHVWGAKQLSACTTTVPAPNPL